MMNSDRWLVFDGGPSRDAKCRAGYDMPAKIILSFEEYQSKLKSPSAEVLRGQALNLIADSSDKVKDIIKSKLAASTAAEVKKQISTMSLQRVQTMVNWLIANNNAEG